MRISTDPADPDYIDERPRKVWCQDRLIGGWTLADEFRRVVITPAGVLNGPVLIERLASLGTMVAEVEIPADEPLVAPLSIPGLHQAVVTPKHKRRK